MGAVPLDCAQPIEDTSSQWPTAHTHISTSGAAFDNHKAFKVAANSTKDVGPNSAHLCGRPVLYAIIGKQSVTASQQQPIVAPSPLGKVRSGLFEPTGATRTWNNL